MDFIMKKIILILLIYSASPLFSHAQNQKILQSKWVKIMQHESSGNFIEADNDFQKFYTSYLKKKIKSKEESNGASPGEAHLETQEELMIAGYLKWSLGIKPFVRTDGTIMSIEERMAIINEARKNQLQK